MSADGSTILLSGMHTRQAACERVRLAPAGFVVKIEPPPRSLDQSSKFYSICSALAQSTMTWDGDRQRKRGWHDLLIHAWMIATGREPRLVKGLNGGRVSLLMSTKDMNKGEMSELIDFATAWCAMHDITLREDGL